ncbi:hypothetical protein [Modicisalibacter muralis]|nr:hypothetical protein [Halomonas muralis]
MQMPESTRSGGLILKAGAFVTIFQALASTLPAWGAVLIAMVVVVTLLKV